MTHIDFNDHLNFLGLKQSEAATLLRVKPRTVRRWQSGEQAIPGAVTELLGAWRQLHAARIPWGADLESIWYGDDDQIRRHQEHDKALINVLERVKARHGPAVPWAVDLKKHTATMPEMTVSFYKLRSGSFSPASYRCRRRPFDRVRDQPHIEDAIAAFHDAITKARTERPDEEWDA
jgi:hypothetical protein